MKCVRCGQKAIVETIEGWFLCSGCESIYNNIKNEPLETKTLTEFKKEIRRFRVKFKAKCPFCNRLNVFDLTDEEIKNDYHFSCDFCDKESQISRYKESA